MLFMLVSLEAVFLPCFCQSCCVHSATLATLGYLTPSLQEPLGALGVVVAQNTHTKKTEKQVDFQGVHGNFHQVDQVSFSALGELGPCIHKSNPCLYGHPCKQLTLPEETPWVCIYCGYVSG